LNILNSLSARNSKAFFLFIVLAIIVVSTGIGYGINVLNDQRLNSLFEGSTKVCKREQPVFYPRVQYKTDSYQNSKNPHQKNNSADDSQYSTNSEADEISYVDGGDRSAVEAAMKKFANEKSSGQWGESAVLARLRSPSTYKDRRPFQSLQVIIPEDGAVYPPNLCPPYIEWEDPENDFWQVNLKVNEQDLGSYLSETRRWRIPSNVWNNLQRDNQNQEIKLQIKGINRSENIERPDKIHASEITRFTISSDPADDYIVYRYVAPPFNSYKTPNIFIRNIGEDHSKNFLSARRRYCINCHTFSSKSGNTGKLSLQIRSLVSSGGNKLPVYVAIYDIDKKTGFKVKLPFEIQMTTFMAWSPDGNQMAYSANQKIAAMKPIIYETQMAGMATSDIALYDLEENETYLLPGASDPNMLEIYPRYSLDGEQLIFARSPVGLHPAHIHYDLCSLSLKEDSDNTAYPIEGASNNGRSNYYPRFSPDGKWLSFCQSDGGDLIRTSSDIYLKNSNLEGDAHCLESNVSYAADSWHSWSSNGKWIVFATKRDSGIYAYLYMTHIDDEGHASPAVPLPLGEKINASFNIPEFVANSPKIRDPNLFDSIRVEQEPRTAKLKKVSIKQR
jgi:WD40 repeat protein